MKSMHVWRLVGLAQIRVGCLCVWGAIGLFAGMSQGFSKESAQDITQEAIQEKVVAPLTVKYFVAREYATKDGDNKDYEFLQYFVDVLTLALDKSGEKYQLTPIVTDILVQGRTNILLQDKTLDVHWLTTNIEYETQLRPIRIPLLKGLIGWRLLLLHKDMLETFANIQTLDELKLYKAGQGRGWTDTDILQFHKLKVTPVTYKKSIMEMLMLKRIDYYPRSMLEIWSDLEYFNVPNLVIDENIALSYPLAMYFFVRKDNIRLSNILNIGLNKAIDDGSFNLLFQQYFAKVIAKAQLNSRKIFYLSNPYMSEETPLNDQRLWYRPIK